MIGKRHRDSTGSNITGVFDAACANELTDRQLERQVPRPLRKRQRMAGDKDGVHNELDHLTSADLAPLEDLNRGAILQGAHNSPYVDPGPPSTHLPYYFGTSTPPFEHTPEPASDSKDELQPFGFSFFPVTSTPHYPPTTSGFSYPPAPQSPSHAAPRFNRHHTGDSDLGEMAQFVDPAALFGESSKAIPSRPISSAGNLDDANMRQSGTGAASLPPRATMYGTELDSDRRFGDFGVEGVASGFWTGTSGF